MRGHGNSGYAAVVLAGGAATRMGGAAKPALPVGGTPLLTRVLATVGAASARVVVGPPALDPLLPPDVVRTHEEPPGGGPVAAVAAGLALVPAEVVVVAVLAADLPFLSTTVIGALRDRLTPDVEAAVLVDAEDRPQWLCALWRRADLAKRLPADPHGAAMRSLAGGATLARVAATGLDRPPPWFDCDTEDDIRRAEEWARE